MSTVACGLELRAECGSSAIFVPPITSGIVQNTGLANYGGCTTLEDNMKAFTKGNRERGFHAQGVYLTQYTSRMGKAMVKQEEEADKRIMRESSKKYGRKERGHKEEKSQTRPN